MCHTRGVETENRYLEEGMEFISFFMFIAWNALLTNFTFGKGESQTANHFLSFDSLMSATLFIYLLYSLLLIQKDLKLQQLAKIKSKTDIEHPPKIGTRFWKIKRYLTKIFYRFFIQEIGYDMQNDKKLWQIQITSFTREQCWHMLKNAYNVLLYIRPWT